MNKQNVQGWFPISLRRSNNNQSGSIMNLLSPFVTHQRGSTRNHAVTKLAEKLDDNERRLLQFLIDIAIALLSAGLAVDILRLSPW
ncbi:hypothetical protein [Bradyrhizobium amphicarpaeae]|uniref:hypothetical protein n=1 Tax=Bradyrhizobium amphicarpaeae TaxID=1404768 RepID=UPI002FE6C32B